MPSTAPVLPREEWTARARAHAERLEPLVGPHLERSLRGEAHPVHDFLFTYYAQRPAALRRWHPGYGVVLEDAPEYDGLKGYDGGTVTAAYLASQRPLVEQLHRLLAATASRPPTLGCFGLHEWAMVYRSAPTGEEPGNVMRHAWPLRLGAVGTDEVVEGHRIGCSHFDAFRFFTPQAVPLNTLQPGSDDRPVFEQPGCLHAGMDLYKHAFRLTPLVSSDLVADAFELAWDIRILDMRAAPYDFTGVRLDPSGDEWTPVRIETPEGKAEYVAMQREFSERGAPIRQSVIEECDRLLAAAS
ncbi:MAG: 3-methyladenine DNA glycosylase [Marmoricola sp.]